MDPSCSTLQMETELVSNETGNSAMIQPTAQRDRQQSSETGNSAERQATAQRDEQQRSEMSDRKGDERALRKASRVSGH